MANLGGLFKGIVEGFAGAAGATDVVERMEGDKQREQGWQDLARQHRILQVQDASLNIGKMLRTGTHPDTGNPLTPDEITQLTQQNNNLQAYLSDLWNPHIGLDQMGKHLQAITGVGGKESWQKQYAKPGPYTTKLSPQDETKFQAWVKQNNIPWQDSPQSDYDMRGYWQWAQANPDQAKTQIGADGKPHFTDRFKTPFHKSFSGESQYAKEGAPRWQGNQLKDVKGHVLYDETTGMRPSGRDVIRGVGSTVSQYEGAPEPNKFLQTYNELREANLSVDDAMKGARIAIGIEAKAGGKRQKIGIPVQTESGAWVQPVMTEDRSIENEPMPDDYKGPNVKWTARGNPIQVDGKYMQPEFNPQGESRLTAMPEGYKPAGKPITASEAMLLSFAATRGKKSPQELDAEDWKAYAPWVEKNKTRFSETQEFIADADGTVHVVPKTTVSRVGETPGSTSAVPAPGSAKTPKSAGSVDKVLPFQKATPSYTKANEEWLAATKMKELAQDLPKASSQEQYNTVLSLIRAEAGRVNAQEIAAVFGTGGFDQWLERAKAKFVEGRLGYQQAKELEDFLNKLERVTFKVKMLARGESAGSNEGTPNDSSGTQKAKVKIQQSKSDPTKFRYSLDGGKTWQTGKPPQQ